MDKYAAAPSRYVQRTGQPDLQSDRRLQVAVLDATDCGVPTTGEMGEFVLGEAERLTMSPEGMFMLHGPYHFTRPVPRWCNINYAFGNDRRRAT